MHTYSHFKKSIFVPFHWVLKSEAVWNAVWSAVSSCSRALVITPFQDLSLLIWRRTLVTRARQQFALKLLDRAKFITHFRSALIRPTHCLHLIARCSEEKLLPERFFPPKCTCVSHAVCHFSAYFRPLLLVCANEPLPDANSSPSL